VVDLAAGPGGKAGHLAALGARVLAVERHPGRARMVHQAARRLGVAERLHAVVGDGRRPPLRQGGADAALVDAPCSNLGSLRRRPEARWRHRPEEIPGLVALQLELLAAAADAVRPGGVVVYSVCTWTRAETDEVVDELRRRRPELVPAPDAGGLTGPAGRRQLWPHLDGGDGVFLARLRKTADAR
jgi:16S rRNA (cytosine967-C5)-methyltransferase